MAAFLMLHAYHAHIFVDHHGSGGRPSALAQRTDTDSYEDATWICVTHRSYNGAALLELPPERHTL